MRRKARILALQALYEIDCSGHNAQDVISARLAEETLPPKDEAFVRTLVFGVLEHLPVLDELIQRYAPEWPVHQLAIVDRNLLRMAIYELIFDRQTPIRVACNEAVTLARWFGSDSSPRFVNGVLGTLTAQYEQLVATYSGAAYGEADHEQAG